MKKLPLILLLGSLWTVLEVSAQQDPHFTQYFDNMLYLNPGYAGSHEVLSLTALHREQWVGFEGRPRTSSFSLHSPVSRSIGLGLSCVNDQIGPMNQTMLFGDFSYSLRFKQSKGRLSFGVKGGVNLVNMNSSSLKPMDDADPDLLNTVQNRSLLNVGAGIYYHHPKWFFGVSAPKLMENSYDGVSSTTERRHFYMMLGGVIGLAPSWKLRPTTHLKISEDAPLSVDLSTAFIYNDKWWLGAMYRLNDSFGGFVQFQMFQQLRAGFAYDHTLSNIASYSQGTFELMLNYRLKFKTSGTISPRYF